MPRWVLLVLAVVVLAGATWWWSGYRSDERRIQRRVDRLMELAEKEPGEAPLAGVERALAITELFAAEFEARARPFDFRTGDRRTLARAIQGYRGGAERIWSRVEESELHVDHANRRAVLHLTARFGGGGLPFGGGDAYRFRVGWVEQDGIWRIDLVDLLEIVP